MYAKTLDAFAALADAELITGHTMFMMLRRFGGAGRARDIAASWSVTWIGNLAGSAALVGLFALGGGGGLLAAPDTLVMKIAALKMSASGMSLFARAILCNWLVCLALWMAARVNSDSAKCTSSSGACSRSSRAASSTASPT